MLNSQGGIRRIDACAETKKLMEFLEKDGLGRNEELLDFLEMLSNIDSGYSIFLDGKWGDGKTIFVKQLELFLKHFSDQWDPENEADQDISEKMNEIAESMKNPPGRSQPDGGEKNDPDNDGETDLEADRDADPAGEIDRDADPAIVRNKEIDPETDIEIDRNADPENDREIDPEILRQNDPDTNRETRMKRVARLYSRKDGEKTLFFTIYFNAWEADAMGDPLIPVVAAIFDALPAKNKNENDGILGKAVTLATALMAVASGVASVAIPSFGLICNAAEKVVKGAADTADIIGKYKNQKAEEADLRPALNKYIDGVVAVKEVEKLVLIIDELDRCRPPFALKLLERVKLLSEREDVITIFSTNTAQLRHTVEGFYGPNMDGERYLQRFYDTKWAMSSVSVLHYLGWRKIKLTDPGQDQYLPKHIALLTQVPQALGFSMRDLNRYMVGLQDLIDDLERKMIVYGDDSDREGFYDCAITPMLEILFIHDSERYQKVRDGYGYEVLRDFCLKHSDFRKWLQLLIPDAVDEASLTLNTDAEKFLRGIYEKRITSKHRSRLPGAGITETGAPSSPYNEMIWITSGQQNKISVSGQDDQTHSQLLESAVPRSASQEQIQSPLQPQQEEVGLYSGKVNQGGVYTFGAYEGRPIEWIVLDVMRGRSEDKTTRKALILSKYCLAQRPYHKVNKPITWEKCSLHTWLNKEFIKTFKENETTKILKETVVNKNNSKYDTPGGNDTPDKIFLLSLDEVQEYLPTDEMRKTTYLPQEKDKKDRGQWAWWWLRSPGLFQIDAAYVFLDGSVYEHGDYVDSDNGGVRPALWLNLES